MKSPREVIDRIMLDWRSATHTAFPAQISAYHAALGTVDVVPGIQREVPTDDPAEPWALEKLPLLYNVPVMWPRGGGYAMTFPLRAGDWCLVVCAEQSTLLWRQTGAQHEAPGLVDPFGLNGLVALPGWFPDAEKMSGVSGTDLVIGSEDGATAIRITPGGVVSLGSHQSDDFVALAAKVDAELANVARAFVTFSPGSGGASFPDAYVQGDSVAAEKVRAK